MQDKNNSKQTEVTSLSPYVSRRASKHETELGLGKLNKS
jgi:hypothetical protein